MGDMEVESHLFFLQVRHIHFVPTTLQPLNSSLRSEDTTQVITWCHVRKISRVTNMKRGPTKERFMSSLASMKSENSLRTPINVRSKSIKLFQIKYCLLAHLWQSLLQIRKVLQIASQTRMDCCEVSLQLLCTYI